MRLFSTYIKSTWGRKKIGRSAIKNIASKKKVSASVNLSVKSKL